MRHRASRAAESYSACLLAVCYPFPLQSIAVLRKGGKIFQEVSSVGAIRAMVDGTR